MKWRMPAKIKIYEALGTIGDGRIEVTGNSAKVFSSSGNKFYTVTYEPEQKAIMANDNASYWQGTLGYPAIAYLLKTGVVTYDERYAQALADIKWKDLNTKFKNDFGKTAEYVNGLLRDQGVDLAAFLQEVEQIQDKLKELALGHLGSKVKPPSGY